MAVHIMAKVLWNRSLVRITTIFLVLLPPGAVT